MCQPTASDTLHSAHPAQPEIIDLVSPDSNGSGTHETLSSGSEGATPSSTSTIPSIHPVSLPAPSHLPSNANANASPAPSPLTAHEQLITHLRQTQSAAPSPPPPYTLFAVDSSPPPYVAASGTLASRITVAPPPETLAREPWHPTAAFIGLLEGVDGDDLRDFLTARVGAVRYIENTDVEGMTLVVFSVARAEHVKRALAQFEIDGRPFIVFPAEEIYGVDE